jgi:hypothetical protein
VKNDVRYLATGVYMFIGVVQGTPMAGLAKGDIRWSKSRARGYQTLYKQKNANARGRWKKFRDFGSAV